MPRQTKHTFPRTTWICGAPPSAAGQATMSFLEICVVLAVAPQAPSVQNHSPKQPFPVEGSLRILGSGAPLMRNPLSGALKSTLPGPREGSSILNVHLVVMSAAVRKGLGGRTYLGRPNALGCLSCSLVFLHFPLGSGRFQSLWSYGMSLRAKVVLQGVASTVGIRCFRCSRPSWV